MKKQVDELLSITQKLNNLFADSEFLQRHCMKIGRMECQLLQYLNEINKPVCMNDLSVRLEVSHSRITRIVDNLVRKNFVSRYPSNIDRRKWFTQITPKGEEIVSLSGIENIALMNNVIKNFSEEEIDDMVILLNRFIKSFNEALAELELKNKK
ncbi:MAG: hypothetical protein CSB55_06245 [Candidatus Cloacimonadota bacterium]|nr:MAG: hypothetical protein CSB55_06245 [Candidatus Cloacimonadota bacterium]